MMKFFRNAFIVFGLSFVMILSLMNYLNNIKYLNNPLEKGYLELSLNEEKYLDFIEEIDSLSFEKECKNFTLLPNHHNRLDIYKSFQNGERRLKNYDSLSTAQTIIDFCEKHDIYNINIDNLEKEVIQFHHKLKINGVYFWLVYLKNGYKKEHFKHLKIIGKSDIQTTVDFEKVGYLYSENWLIYSSESSYKN